MKEQQKSMLVLAMITAFIITGLLLPAIVRAGDLEPTAGPDDPGSAMYTIEDIYNYLDTGVVGTKRSSGFTEPTSEPGSTMHTLDDIMDKAMTSNTFSCTGDASTDDVLLGKTFSNATSTELTGAMTNVGQQNVTPGTASQTITQGYHDGTGQVVGDADLVSGNIRSSVSIFGVAGDSNVADTSSGDAVSSDILTGKKAWVGGSEVTGTGALAALPAPVEKTGQTTSYETRDDGDLKKGVTWPNPRFTDNADGTVTDNLTGLMWLKEANCIYSNYSGFDTDGAAGDGKVIWQNALNFVAGINDGTYPDCGGGHADWRLPNVKELQSLIDFGEHNPALPSGHPFTGVRSDDYWSSTTYASFTSHAWSVYMLGGDVIYINKDGGGYVWPVRADN